MEALRYVGSDQHIADGCHFWSVGLGWRIDELFSTSLYSCTEDCEDAQLRSHRLESGSAKTQKRTSDQDMVMQLRVCRADTRHRCWCHGQEDQRKQTASHLNKVLQHSCPDILPLLRHDFDLQPISMKFS